MCAFILFVQAVNAFCLMLLTIPSIGLMTLQLKQVALTVSPAGLEVPPH